MKLKEKITAIFFLLTLGLLLLRIVGSSGYQYLSSHLNPQEQPPAYDALAAYPFPDAAEPDAQPAAGGALHRAIQMLKSLKEFISVRTSASSPYLEPFVIGKRLGDRMMGLDLTASLTAGENNLSDGEDVVALWQGDSLGFVLDDIDPTEYAEQLISFGQRMEAEGRDFLFLMVPSKQAKTPAFPDYSEKKRAEVLQLLRQSGTDFIDMEAEIERNHLNKEDLFFRTDHHWLPTSGLWADELVCRYLNEHYGRSIDTERFSPEQYEITVLEDAFLGSQGNKVSTIYCAPEDFPVVTPKYDTDLDVFVSGKNLHLRGSIQETLFDGENRGRYSFYGYSDQALIQVHNHDVHDGSRLLVIKTSFANCMIPYLSAAVEYLDAVDLRNFNGSLEALIEETNPDTLLIVYGIATFESNGSQFDFR